MAAKQQLSTSGITALNNC